MPLETRAQTFSAAVCKKAPLNCWALESLETGELEPLVLEPRLLAAILAQVDQLAPKKIPSWQNEQMNPLEPRMAADGFSRGCWHMCLPSRPRWPGIGSQYCRGGAHRCESQCRWAVPRSLWLYSNQDWCCQHAAGHDQDEQASARDPQRAGLRRAELANTLQAMSKTSRPLPRSSRCRTSTRRASPTRCRP